MPSLSKAVEIRQRSLFVGYIVKLYDQYLLFLNITKYSSLDEVDHVTTYRGLIAQEPIFLSVSTLIHRLFLSCPRDPNPLNSFPEKQASTQNLNLSLNLRPVPKFFKPSYQRTPFLMDAEAYLKRHGWSGPGNPLNENSRPGPHGGLGLTRPILVARKQNNHGVGKKITKDSATNQWWLRGFEDALKGVGEEKPATTASTANALTSELYRFFVRGEGLAGTLRDEKPSKSKSSKSKRKRNDEDEDDRNARKKEKAARKEKKEEKRKRRKVKEESDTGSASGDSSQEEKRTEKESKEERRARRKEKKEKKLKRSAEEDYPTPMSTEQEPDPDVTESPVQTKDKKEKKSRQKSKESDGDEGSDAKKSKKENKEKKEKKEKKSKST